MNEVEKQIHDMHLICKAFLSGEMYSDTFRRELDRVNRLKLDEESRVKLYELNKPYIAEVTPKLILKKVQKKLFYDAAPPKNISKTDNVYQKPEIIKAENITYSGKEYLLLRVVTRLGFFTSDEVENAYEVIGDYDSLAAKPIRIFLNKKVIDDAPLVQEVLPHAITLCETGIAFSGIFSVEETEKETRFTWTHSVPEFGLLPSTRKERRAYMAKVVALENV